VQGRKRNISYSPYMKWKQRLKMVASISLFYAGQLGEIHMVKDNKWVWVAEMVVKRKVILAYPNHRDNRCILE
jgi:hypothetical protein